MMAFDPTIPTYLQKLDYTCAVGSTIWMLRSLGIDVTPEDAHDAMVPKYVTSDVGLLDASGAGVVAVLRDHWGVGAINDASATFDEVAAVAGRQPVMIGLRNWGGPGLGHWSAVRGFRNSGNLELANPAGPGPKFGHQLLNREEFDARGPASMVTVPIGASASAPSNETPKAEAPTSKPDAWQFFTAEQIAAVTACPLDAIRSHWPRLVEQLAHCKINIRPAQIAMLATVAIETARRFAPIHEFRNADGSLPAHWQTYGGGPNFHGRGFIQLTHDYNYRAYGPKVAALWGTSPDQPDFDLVGDPDRALDPDVSAAIAAIYFKDRGIPQMAAIGDWVAVRRAVQGGTAGLEAFTKMANSLTALPADVIPPAPVFDRAAAAARVRALLTLHEQYCAEMDAEFDKLLAMIEAA